MQPNELIELGTALRTHPDFPEAARQLVCNLANWRSRLRAHNRVFSDLGRFCLITQFLFLHYSFRLQGREVGASFGDLCAAQATGLKLGPRAVRTTLTLLKEAGLVVVRKSPQDLRMRLYEPTPMLVEVARGYMLAVFCVFDALAPGLGVCARLRDDPEYATEIIGRLGNAYFGFGSDLFRQGHPFSRLLHYDGASPIVAVIVHCYWNNQRLPTGYELAARFKVSQTQVRAVLAAAAKMGLLTLGERGRVQDVAPLVEAFLKTYCGYLAFYGRVGLELEAERFSRAPKELVDG